MAVRKRFTVRQAKPEDIDSGWVWLTLPEEMRGGQVLKIVNMNGMNSVYCYARAIDKSFAGHYNEAAEAAGVEPLHKATYNASGRMTFTEEGVGIVVISQWYRDKLGYLQPMENCELALSVKDDNRGRVLACLAHPELSVRLSTQLGRTGFWLGVSGVGLGLLGAILGGIGVWIAVVPH